MWSRRSCVSFVSSMPVISLLAITTLPVVGVSSPAMMCINVDLPEPEGPITATSSPVRTSRDTPRSASTAVASSP
jgi:hypothetical protein